MSLKFDSLADKFVKRLIRHSWWILILFMAATAITAPRAVRLITTITSELSALLPDDHTSVALSRQLKKKFKKSTGGNLALIVESPHTEKNKQVMIDLANNLRALPDVREVKIERKNYKFFDDHKLLYIDLEDLQKVKERVQRQIQKEKLKGLYVDLEEDETKSDGNKNSELKFDDLIEKYSAGYGDAIDNPFYISEDNSYFVAFIYPKSTSSSLSFYAQFTQMIKEKIRDFPFSNYGPGLKVSYAGSMQTRLNEYNTLISDLTRAGIISMMGIFLGLVIYFRRVLATLILFIPLVSGICFGFFICSFFIEKLNVVTSFLFSILFGLGIDIGIHCLARYLEDRKQGLPVAECIHNLVLKTGRSSFVSIMTTVAAFFVLLVNDFKGFSEFGWIAGIGLLTTLASYMILLPCLLKVGESTKLISIRRPFGFNRDFFKKMSRFFHGKEKKFFYASIVLFFLGAASIAFVRFEWNFSNLKIKISETEEAKKKLAHITGRVNSPATLLIKDKEEARLLKEEIRRKKEADLLTPTIDRFRSVYDLSPDDQPQKMALLSEIDKLLSDDTLHVLKGDRQKKLQEFRQAIATTRMFGIKDVPQENIEVYYGQGEYKDEMFATIQPLPDLELDDGRNAIHFRDDVFHIKAGGKDFHSTSDAIIFADVLTTMFKDSRKAILLSLLAMVIIIYLDFFNWKKSALVLAYLSLGMFGMFLLMVVFGWKLNFYNMICIPVVLGMGEDNIVHLLHRFEELGRKNLFVAWISAGVPAAMASLTTILGYFGLVFAHHPGLQSIGILAVAGMTTCMISSLILFPVFLKVFYSKGSSWN
ncbi:MAG TPA: hypothetical protein DDW49_03900 [Deltaproteobacteria bacterium]|nr:hypothetical protein [Deltaproteobacteria bacterium]